MKREPVLNTSDLNLRPEREVTEIVGGYLMNVTAVESNTLRAMGNDERIVVSGAAFQT